MNTEFLSVVDENDRVLTAMPRHEIHALGLPHRAVHILVFNDQNQLFLQKRSIKKDLNKGLWDSSAAGHVDAGEDYLASAVRETREELGINVEDTLKFLFKLSPTQQLGMEFIKVYLCRHNGPLVLNAEEIEMGEWCSIKDISVHVDNDNIKLTETFKAIWRQYQTNSF